MTQQEKADRYDRIVAVMPAWKFEQLAAWLDKYDSDRGKRGEDEVQRDLRAVRDIIAPENPGDWKVKF